MHALTEAVLAFINHFPLFVLLLRVKDPWRLPGLLKPSPLIYILKLNEKSGGVYLDHSSPSNASILIVKVLGFVGLNASSFLTSFQNRPMTLGSIFIQYSKSSAFLFTSFILLTIQCSPIMVKVFVALSSIPPDQLHPVGRISNGHSPTNYTLRA